MRNNNFRFSRRLQWEKVVVAVIAETLRTGCAYRSAGLCV